MTAIKKAVEHYKGVWPKTVAGYTDKCFVIGECVIGDSPENLIIGEIHALGKHYSTKHFTVICTKQQFEDYVKEQQMQEPKFKYVNAGIKTVGELFQVLLLDEIQIFHNESQVTINGYADVYCGDFGVDRLKINRIDAMLPTLTTRHPLPWYEVEGVFDEAKLCSVDDGLPVFIHEYDDRGWLKDGLGNNYKVEDCTPLSPSEAAKYGVERGE